MINSQTGNERHAERSLGMGRFAPGVRAASLIAIAVGSIAIAERLPLRSLAEPIARRLREPGVWTLLVFGLVAAIAVTVYATRRSRNASSRQPAWTWRTTLLAATGLALLVLGGYAQAEPDAIESLLNRLTGPPQVEMREAYADKPDGPRFDHGELDDLLRAHVFAGGAVDYDGIKRDIDKLESYLRRLADAPFNAMGRDEKLALLINAYNAFTLKLIIEHYPIDSIKSIPSVQSWDDARWKVGPHIWSLNQIEHEQIRPKFREPRIHFALVCAAVGCPPLRSEAYLAARLDEQLDDQAKYVHAHDRWVRYKAETNTLMLTSLYKWYGGDFKQAADSVVEYVSGYVPSLRNALEAGRDPSLSWLDYDWSLNSEENLR